MVAKNGSYTYIICLYYRIIYYHHHDNHGTVGRTVGFTVIRGLESTVPAVALYPHSTPTGITTFISAKKINNNRKIEKQEGDFFKLPTRQLRLKIEELENG